MREQKHKKKNYAGRHSTISSSFRPAEDSPPPYEDMFSAFEEAPEGSFPHDYSSDEMPSSPLPHRSGRQKPKKRAGSDRVRRVKITAFILLFFLALLFSAATYAGYVITHRQTILPNIYVGGVFVGNMSREQAAAAMEKANWNAISAQKLEVSLVDRVSFSVDPCEAGCRFPMEEGIDAAFRYGHTGNWYLNLFEYIRCLSRPVDVNHVFLEDDRSYVLKQVNAAISTLERELGDGGYEVLEEQSVLHMVKGAGSLQFDQNAIADAIFDALKKDQTQLSYTTPSNTPSPPDFQAIHDRLSAEPKDASYSDDNKFTVIDHVVGCDFSPAEALLLWEQASYAADVEIPLKITYPKVTSEYLHSLLFRDLLGATTTYYKNSIDNRINNLNLAASKINGLILYPGDVFSYNELIGKRTTEAGFLPAGAYENGEVVEEVGGGICQVSSTLYSAMLYGYKLTTVERSPHYFPVDYLEKGYDATVSWPKPDFKFRNDRDYPIKLVAVCNNEERSLTVEIWGTNLDGYHIALKKDTRAYNNAKYPWIMEGYGVQVFRYILDAHGMQVDQVNEIYDVYHTHEATEQIKALDAQAAQQAAMEQAAAALEMLQAQ